LTIFLLKTYCSQFRELSKKLSFELHIIKVKKSLGMRLLEKFIKNLAKLPLENHTV